MLTPTVVSTDQAFNFTLKFRKGEGRTFSFHFREDSGAHDISAYGFEFSVYELDSDTALFTLTEDSGGGLTNGGSDGILTAAPTDANVALDPSTYQWRLKITNPSTITWGHGLFSINNAPNTTTAEDTATVNMDNGDVVIEVTLTVASFDGFDVSSLTDAQVQELWDRLMQLS